MVKIFAIRNQWGLNSFSTSISNIEGPNLEDQIKKDHILKKRVQKNQMKKDQVQNGQVWKYQIQKYQAQKMIFRRYRTSCSIRCPMLSEIESTLKQSILFILVRYTHKLPLLLQFYRIKYLGESSYSSNTGQAHISLSKIFILPWRTTWLVSLLLEISVQRHSKLFNSTEVHGHAELPTRLRKVATPTLSFHPVYWTMTYELVMRVGLS